MTQAHLNWDIGKMLGYKKQWKLQVSACQQQTLRNSTMDYEVVKLNSMQLGAGMESEIMSSIDILAGYTMLQGKGNEMLAARNGYTEVIDFTGYNANLQNNAAAAGLRVRFSNKTYLSLLYQRMNYRNLLQPYQNYTIGQFQAIYNMTF
jgi:opacity protein-like surface antigen